MSDRLGLIRSHYSRELISPVKIAKEALSDSPATQSIVKAHNNLKTGLKVVGFGCLSLFTIRTFLKDEEG